MRLSLHCALWLLSLIILSGCGAGASGDNEVTTTPTIGAKLIVDTLNADGQAVTTVSATETVVVRVRALNDFGRAAPSVAINFTTDLGALSQDSALTDADGYASVNLVTTITDLGVANLSVTGTVDGTALSANGLVEVTAQTSETPPTLTIASYDNQCQQATNEAIVGSSLCIKATLKRQGIPLANERISFSADLGVLSPGSALTDDTGTAITIIQSSSNDLNAGTVNASALNQTASANYQFVAATASVSLTLKTYLEDCTTQNVSFTAGSTVCLSAALMDGQAPVPNQIINFDAPLGTLRQFTALTNAQGVAQVLADSTTDLLGAAAAVATFNNVQASSNYEFISNAGTPSAGPQMQLLAIQDNLYKNRLRAEQNAQLQATIKDAQGIPLVDTIVSFTAERGILASDKALTDPQGVAEVTITGEASNIGAAIATAEVNIAGTSYTTSYNYEITAPDAVVESAKIGYFADANTFVEGKIGASIARNEQDNIPLSAGGTVGLNIVVVNQDNERITSPTLVTFSSACQSNGQTSLDTQVTTINGEARSTYEDLSCATVSGNHDVLVASITVNSVTLSASATIDLAPESVGSIEFVSAEPTSIVLQGTGGQGKQETSTLTYQVKGVLGNPLVQQEVTFALDSNVGDLTISPVKSLTNSQGLVSTKVTSGNVPAAVRVTATTRVIKEGEPDREISTQSDLLSVNTGLPDQNSITLSTALFNPEANSFSGKEVVITAFMADSFNNPVPDGTTINFTTEGGLIQPSCNTTNGNCKVTWTGANPRVGDHRITILATAIGHETFFDTNGNNVFDNDDGGAIDQGTDSGFDRESYAQSGFIDHSEAWRDDNENRQKDTGEIFIDFDNDNRFDAADGLFNGPQCTHDSLCGDSNHTKINVRKALVMVMSGSDVRYTLMTDDLSPGNNAHVEHIGSRHVLKTNDTANNVVADGFVTVSESGTVVNNGDLIIVDEGLSLPIRLDFSDTAAGLGQILPAGTQVQITTSAGSIAGSRAFTVPNSIGYFNTTGVDQFGGSTVEFSIVNAINTTNTSDEEGLITIFFEFPESKNTFTITLPVYMRNRF